MKKVKVAIIGAGSAGLAARRQVAKKTNDYIIIDAGTLGTTCARVGCMPSKVLIQVANDFHRRKKFDQEGILGGENLSLDRKKVMEHVRALRDRFVRGVLGDMQSWQEEHFLAKTARFRSAHVLDCDGEEIEAEKIIITTGSRPIVPEQLKGFEKYLLTTDQIFELKSLPNSMAILGLGVIGLELGQAFSRLGTNILGIARSKKIGGLLDPQITDYAIQKFSEEMNLSFDGLTSVTEQDGKLLLKSGAKEILVEKILVTTGRKPNWDNLAIQNILPGFSESDDFYNTDTYQLKKFPHIYIAGDISGKKQILHEASDEGRIAGYNCTHEPQEFKARCPLYITFSDPNIARAGLSYQDLVNSKRDFATGQVSFEGQGRSIVKLKEMGLLHVYGDKKTGILLGAEMFGPETEHIAHLLSWVISQHLTVNHILSFPFYHPVIEEGLRTALRDLQKKLALPIPVLESVGESK